MTTTPALPTTEHRGTGRTHNRNTTVNLLGCRLFISTGRGVNYYSYTFDNGTEIIIRTPEDLPDRHTCTVNAVFVTAEEAEHALQQQFAEAAMK